jgi:hypothetical protein
VFEVEASTVEEYLQQVHQMTVISAIQVCHMYSQHLPAIQSWTSLFCRLYCSSPAHNICFTKSL